MGKQNRSYSGRFWHIHACFEIFRYIQAKYMRHLITSKTLCNQQLELCDNYKINE